MNLLTCLPPPVRGGTYHTPSDLLPARAIVPANPEFTGDESMTEPTAPHKTMPVIAIVAADMRRVVGAEPTAPHASTWRQMGELTVTLSRAHSRWALTLEGDEPIPQILADLWATAVSAPSVEWWRTQEGCRLRADWQEVQR